MRDFFSTLTLVSLLTGPLATGVLIWLSRRPDRCPICRARAVRVWHAVESYPLPMPRFSRCERCGARLKRLFRGPWEDATATEYDRYYRDAPELPLPPAATYRR